MNYNSFRSFSAIYDRFLVLFKDMRLFNKWKDILAVKSFHQYDSYIKQNIVNIKTTKESKTKSQIPKIANFDDLYRLHKEIYGEKDFESMSKEELTISFRKFLGSVANLEKMYKIEGDNFPQFTRDFKRIDYGLMISRPPLFINISDWEIAYQKYKRNFWIKYPYPKIGDVNNEIIKNLSGLKVLYKDKIKNQTLTLDEFPTHIIKNKNGNINGNKNQEEYFGSSKDFLRIDPNITDSHSLHYAPANRVYLIFKNKNGKWIFPTITSTLKKSIKSSLETLLLNISKDKWKSILIFKSPNFISEREFNDEDLVEGEKKLLNNVVTLFFEAEYLSGYPEDFPFDDYSWVPKRCLNKYFQETYYNNCINALTDI